MYLNNVNQITSGRTLRGQLVWSAIVVSWWNGTRNAMHRPPRTPLTGKQVAAIAFTFLLIAWFVAGAVLIGIHDFIGGLWLAAGAIGLGFRAALAIKGGRAPYWNAPPKITNLAELRRQVF